MWPMFSSQEQTQILCYLVSKKYMSYLSIYSPSLIEGDFGSHVNPPGGCMGEVSHAGIDQINKLLIRH